MDAHVQVLKAVALLQKSDAAGAKELATAFGGSSQAEVVSLQAARSMMRPPGVRDHDNDPSVYRDVEIVPTPSELRCSEQVRLVLLVQVHPLVSRCALACADGCERAD
jgi:hypothetical protein